MEQKTINNTLKETILDKNLIENLIFITKKLKKEMAKIFKKGHL
jgi:hypothetical protein